MKWNARNDINDERLHLNENDNKLWVFLCCEKYAYLRILVFVVHCSNKFQKIYIHDIFHDSSSTIGCGWWRRSIRKIIEIQNVITIFATLGMPIFNALFRITHGRYDKLKGKPSIDDHQRFDEINYQQTRQSSLNCRNENLMKLKIRKWNLVKKFQKLTIGFFSLNNLFKCNYYRSLNCLPSKIRFSIIHHRFWMLNVFSGNFGDEQMKWNKLHRLKNYFFLCYFGWSKCNVM